MTTPSAAAAVAPSTDYLQEYLPPEIVEKLEAGAFRSLCGHLRERSDEVQNMDLMTVSGFCRNCLAKWLVMEARGMENVSDAQVQQALDALGYAEAAEYVYGCDYGEWKKRHATKASDEKMLLYQNSKPLWAQHDKQLLETRAEKPSSSALLSNVCCQDVVDDKVSTTLAISKGTTSATIAATPDPPKGGVKFKVGILTVSDRAASNQYKTGDLSGPAVKESLETTVKSMNGKDTNVSFELVETGIVPDSLKDIQQTLQQWCASHEMDLILTTGGTGFAPRDVTPEATRDVLDKTSHGLMSYCLSLLQEQQQPLASLSRGTAGVCENTLICNLPGNPRAATEIVPVLLPLALHAIQDLQKEE